MASHFSFLAGLVWTALIATSYFLNANHAKDTSIELAHAEARALLNKDLGLINWSTRHGGVYVPISKHQQPIEFLSHLSHRDVTTTDGVKLTLVNPASMLRQVMSEYADQFGVKGRITGLKVINPANAPDEWERQQIQQSTQNKDYPDEVWQLADIDGQPYLRHLRVMQMESGCMDCHGHLGFKVGDVRGARSINLPMAPYLQSFDATRMDLIVTHILIWAIVLMAIIWIGRRAARQTQILDLTVKQRTAELEASRDAAHAGLASREAFIANMSHEIRTPMNAIMGYSEVVSHDPLLTSDSQRRIGIINSSAKSLLGVMNDILDLTKIRNSNFNLEATPFHLRNAIDDLISANQYRIQEKSLTFTADYADDLPRIVEGDPTRLRQVLGNLLDNAIKFTDEGSIHLAVNVDENPELLVFSIRDTGIGMSPDQLSRIFEPFVQADQSTTRRFGGTGLGTGISKQIVKMMEGDIWVESVEGKGSTFHFNVRLLPAASGDRNILFADADDERFQSPRTFRILVAEDLETNAELLTIWLEEQGHTITWTRNGVEAVDRVQHEEFDVLLMDIQMPEMDGLQATRLIRGIEQETGSTEPLTIIALTASVMREDLDKCRLAGMDEVTSKPVNRNELLQLIEKTAPPGVGEIAASRKQKADSISASDFDVISGLADSEAAKKWWGQLEPYVDGLKMFAATHKADPDLLAGYLAETPQDAEKAATLLHTLKGVAGNLLLRHIQSLCEQLERSVHHTNPDDQQRLLSELHDVMEETITAIDDIDTEKAQKQQKQEFVNTEDAPVKIRAMLEKLLDAVDQLSPDLAKLVIEDLEKYLAPSILASIKSSLATFDFHEARNAIITQIEGLQLPDNPERLS